MGTKKVMKASPLWLITETKKRERIPESPPRKIKDLASNLTEVRLINLTRMKILQTFVSDTRLLESMSMEAANLEISQKAPPDCHHIF